jgi:hypothetical protein
MATSKPGYGAVPSGHSGQILTTSGINGSSWMAPQMAHNAIQIGNPEPAITFHMDGNITTQAGTITSEDWITVIQTMKQLIMDMSKDQELVSKYPYIQDAAHNWLINELKGKDNGNKKT